MLMSADCKPSSVVNGHLSMQPVTRLLERWSEAKRAVSYASIYLAPGGVYMTGQSPGRRYALTAPFHPYRLLGGISLLHLPWSRLHQPLTGTLPFGARTFLMPFQARDHSSASTFKSFYPMINLPQVSHSTCLPERMTDSTDEGNPMLHPPHWPLMSLAIGGEQRCLIVVYFARYSG